MPLPSSLKCALGYHRPSRGSLTWDPKDYAYVATCRRCGKPIKRVAHRNWRLREV